jgi:hypothetical protein
VRYEHTQYGSLHLILLVPAAAMLAVAAVVPLMPLRIVMLVAGAVMILLAASFRRLTVRDGVDRLLIEFGPLPLFRKSIPYSEIEAVEHGRTIVLDGWGMQYVPGRGWTYSLWGFGCVLLRLAHGKTLRIGTDDPEGLAAFLIARGKP